MERAGISSDELERLYVSGTFGSNLDTGNARTIGLLPMMRDDRIRLCGNTASAGCEQVLVDPTAVRKLETVRQSARIENLAGLPDFDNLFLENLYLRPLGGA